MTLPLLPNPADDADNRRREDEEPRHDQQQQNHARGSGRQSHIAGEEECLAALSRLPALVALRMLTTAQANTIRATYTAMLQHHRQQRTKSDHCAGADNDALIAQLVRNPELANLLEPLLSKEQIAAIMARAGNGSDGIS